MGTDRTVSVDFVLLRSVTRGIKGQDSRNKLYTFIHANIPSVNSLLSAYMCLEKPTGKTRDPNLPDFSLWSTERNTKKAWKGSFPSH